MTIPQVCAIRYSPQRLKAYKSQFAPADSAFSLKYRKAKEKYEKAGESGVSDEEKAEMQKMFEEARKDYK